MSTIDPATVRAVTREMADWLEGRHFGVRAMLGADPDLAATMAACWADGYRRAIHELRWAAAEPVQIPDDARELDGED